MLSRGIENAVRASLSDSPVVFVQGARQTGKSTLVKALVAETPARYLTLDDATTLSAAHADPQGFVEGFTGPVVIDEVQRAPGLGLAIKRRVDRDRQPGRFILTGSANPLLLPRMADSLAGRMEVHTLWPMSQGEWEGRGASGSHWVDRLFAPTFELPTGEGEPWPRLVDRMARGGYPEMLRRDRAARRDAWFGSYLLSILQRDVRDLSNVQDLSQLPRLLGLMASRSSGLLDYADLSRGLGMPQTTLKRYAALLDATFLTRTLPAWFANVGKRLVKAPKLLLTDTGLLCHLVGTDANRLRSDPAAGGPILETFVALELIKQLGWSDTPARLHHYRTHAGAEVDLVLEDSAGRVVGIEVKATSSVQASDFTGLRALSEAAGDRFVRGVLLSTSPQAIAFGRNLYALPVSSMWA